MDLNPKQYFQKPDLNSLQVIKRRFAPENIPDFAAIAKDGPDTLVRPILSWQECLHVWVHIQ